MNVLKEQKRSIITRFGDRKHTPRWIKNIYHRKSWKILYTSIFIFSEFKSLTGKMAAGVKIVYDDKVEYVIFKSV